MRPYLFVITGVPMPNNQNFETVAGAKIHIWVMDNSIETARNQAITYIKNYLWEPQETEYEFEIQPARIADLDIVEANLYEKALRNGIAMALFGWPKDNSNPDAPIIIDHA